MRAKSVFVGTVFALAVLIGASFGAVRAQAAPAETEKTAATGPSMEGYEPQAPSIYGEQGPPAVNVPGAGGAGVGASQDTALGRGGIVMPAPTYEGESSVNAGIPSAGTADAAGMDKTDPAPGGRKSFPLLMMIVGAFIVVVVLVFMFRMKRSD